MRDCRVLRLPLGHALREVVRRRLWGTPLKAIAGLRAIKPPP